MHKSLLRRAPSFAALAQTPLYPGMGSRIRSFDGEHTYSHSAQNMEALKESRAWLIIAGAVLGPIAGAAAFGAHLTAFGPAAMVYPAYAGATAAVLRLVAKGRSNAITKDLSGKTVLLLGGTGDIGRHVAKSLLEMGATVVIASRSAEPKVAEVKAFLAEAAAKPTTTTAQAAPQSEKGATSTPPSSQQQQQRLFFSHIDLAYLSSIRFFSKNLREAHPSLHMIINCSGVMRDEETISKYGDEEQLATNVLGPYLLIESLLPNIRETNGRIVHVASNGLVACSDKVVKSYLGHKGGLWNPNDPNHKFDGIEQYGFTKLCNLYHAQQLAERSYAPDSFSAKQQRGLMGDAGRRKLAAEGSIFGAAGRKGGQSPTAARPKMVVEKMEKFVGIGAGDAEPVAQLEGGGIVSAPAKAKASSTAPSSGGKSNLVSSKEVLKAATAAKSENAFDGREPAFTAVAVNPGGAITNLFRSIPSAHIMKNPLAYPAFTLLMKTPEEGAQTILHCALTDDLVNGGYYQNCAYAPNALPKVACSKAERTSLMEWVKKRTHAVMEKQQSWRPKK